jgi:hypothetical protein
VPVIVLTNMLAERKADLTFPNLMASFQQGVGEMHFVSPPFRLCAALPALARRLLATHD